MTAMTGGNGTCASIDLVQRAVASSFGVTVTDLKSCRRDKKTSHARQAAMLLCREITPFSLTVIGWHFGKRDHTTVGYAVRAVKARRTESPELANALTQLTDDLSTSLGSPTGELERGKALAELGSLLKRRDALLAELELVDARIDEIGRSTFGAGGTEPTA